MKTGLTKKQKTTAIFFDEDGDITEVMTHNNQPFGRNASAQIEMKVCRQTAAFLIK